MKLTAVILTLNEELHLSRCIESIKSIGAEVVVVDCYSNDATLEIARNCGAKVFQKAWVNYAMQFNWALTQLGQDTDWVLRIDSDEYLTSELADEIQSVLPALGREVEGVYFGRRMNFMGQPIRYGGVFPVQVLRLFRYGKGRCENRWMDEHIKVAGATIQLRGELIDDNLNSLTWWIDKHNKYASREVVDLLNLRHGFMPHDTVAALGGSQASVKRWIKERVYSRLPGGFRAFAYFFYRYILRFGFLDGKNGAAFHILQGFWYRYLIDAKIHEVERYMTHKNVDVVMAIDHVLGIKILSDIFPVANSET